MNNIVVSTILYQIVFFVGGVVANAPAQGAESQSEDEAAIRAIVSSWDRMESNFRDVDWENAFGVRLKGYAAVDEFITKRVRPTQRTANMKIGEIRVNFVTASIAVADRYWELIGQTDGENGPKLPDRKGRTTYVLERKNGVWTVVIERIADLRTSSSRL